MALALAALVDGPIAGAVSAQTRAAFVPSFAVTTLYDDNVFLTSRAAAADRIVRMRPALTAERHFPRGRYAGWYTVDAEHFALHRELTSPLARVQAFSRVHYNAGRRLVLAADHGYVNTTAPMELNMTTALATSRIRTTRVSGSASAAYRVSRRTTGTASHSLTADRLDDGRAMRASTSRIAFDRTLSHRERLQIDYEHSRFDAASHSTGADAVRLGWTRAIGGRTQLQLRGGPRVTAGSSSADLLALAIHTRENTTVSVSLEQTQTTAIGLDVPVEALSVQLRGRWRPNRSLSLGIAPGAFRSTFAAREIDVVRIAADARYAITRTAAIEAALSVERQRGTVASRDSAAAILRHRTLSIALAQQWK